MLTAWTFAHKKYFFLSVHSAKLTAPLFLRYIYFSSRRVYPLSYRYNLLENFFSSERKTHSRNKQKGYYYHWNNFLDICSQEKVCVAWCMHVMVLQWCISRNIFWSRKEKGKHNGRKMKREAHTRAFLLPTFFSSSANKLHSHCRSNSQEYTHEFIIRFFRVHNKLTHTSLRLINRWWGYIQKTIFSTKVGILIPGNKKEEYRWMLWNFV